MRGKCWVNVKRVQVLDVAFSFVILFLCVLIFSLLLDRGLFTL